MSMFSDVQRVWCLHCDHRVLKVWTRDGICLECLRAAEENSRRDDEMRSLRGYTDEERERI